MSESNNSPNRVDRFITGCKNHPYISVLIVIGAIVISIGRFTDASARIAALWSSIQEHNNANNERELRAFIPGLINSAPRRFKGYCGEFDRKVGEDELFEFSVLPPGAERASITIPANHLDHSKRSFVWIDFKSTRSEAVAREKFNLLTKILADLQPDKIKTIDDPGRVTIGIDAIRESHYYFRVGERQKKGVSVDLRLNRFQGSAGIWYVDFRVSCEM